MSWRCVLTCAIAVLIACLSLNTDAQAGLIDLQTSTTYGPQEVWRGFGADFSPDWEGETKIVDAWQEPEDDTSSSWITSCGLVGDVDYGMYGAIITCPTWRRGHWEESGGHWESHPTVRQVSASSDSQVSNSTWLRLDGQDYSASKGDSGGAAMARYARLMSPWKQILTKKEVKDGLINGYELQTIEPQLLAESSSIAYRNADFGDDEFSLDGRVSAAAILNRDAQEAFASSSGRSWYEATYELDQDTDFTLDIDLSILGQIDFSFTATDADNGEVAFEFNTISDAINYGTRQDVSMDGSLEAGTYEFAVNCLTDASVDSLGRWNPGGQAMFDVSLDLEEEYVQVWVPDYVWVSDYPPALRVVDDSSDNNLEIGCVVTLLTNASLYGACFTNASIDDACIISEYGFTAVPEPSTLTLLLLGGLGCLVSARRRAKTA